MSGWAAKTIKNQNSIINKPTSVGVSMTLKTVMENQVDELISNANKMGVAPEAIELIDSFDEMKAKIARKVAELSALEAIAMESTDENVSSLRQELFSITKMIHGDLLNEVMEQYDIELERNSDKKDYAGDCSSSVYDGTEEISKWDILEKMRRYLNKRAHVKEIMRNLDD